MSGFNIGNLHFDSRSKPGRPSLSEQTQQPKESSYLDVGTEGVCPKTGNKMRLVKLMAAPTPQMVWYCDESRIALPCSDPQLI